MDAFIPNYRRLWLYLLCVLVLTYLAVPTLIVIPMSFSASDSLSFPPQGLSLRWYVQYFSMPEWRDPTIVSFELATFTTLLATPLGTAAAYGLHVAQLRAAQLVRGLLLSPLMVPIILFAIAAYFAYARIGLVNTLSGLVLADTVLTIPFVLVSVTAALKSYDMSQEMVARSLGAPRLTAFLTVTLPQIRYGVISGALFAFVTAFDEVVIASILSNGERATLTNRMFASLLTEVDPTIAAISTLMIMVTMVPPLVLHFATLGRKSAGMSSAAPSA
jgi:putative spermidine/putrescine transport system permease protein